MNAAPTEPTTIAMSRGIPSVVGVTVGTADGYADGTAVGSSEGGGDGDGDGWAVGPAVGMGVGTGEGRTDGTGVVGAVVGVSVGHQLSLHPCDVIRQPARGGEASVTLTCMAACRPGCSAAPCTWPGRSG